MARLDQLLAYEGFSAVDKARFQQEKVQLMLQPIVSLESCSIGHPSGVTPENTNSSVTATEDETQQHRIRETIRPRNISDELDADTCCKAGSAPIAVMGSAAITLGRVHDIEAIKKTSEYHLKTLRDKRKRLFQPKKIPDKNQLFKYLTQQQVRFDAGYDQDFFIDNDSYSIITANDVLEYQPQFLAKFLTDFDLINEDDPGLSPPNDSIFEAFVYLVCSRDSHDETPFEEHPTVQSMRVLISNHIRTYVGNIPGSVYNFDEDRIFIPNFDGDIDDYCSELAIARCGDPIVLQAFCHLFEFDAIQFSVKEPGGTLYQGDIKTRPTDVFSILLEVHVGSDCCDRYTLAMPKCGRAMQTSSSFLNSNEGSNPSMTDAEEVLRLAANELQKLRSEIANDEMNVRYRRDDINQKIRNENKKKLAESEAAHDAARKSLEKIKASKSDAFLTMLEDSEFSVPDTRPAVPMAPSIGFAASTASALPVAPSLAGVVPVVQSPAASLSEPHKPVLQDASSVLSNSAVSVLTAASDEPSLAAAAVSQTAQAVSKITTTLTVDRTGSFVPVVQAQPNQPKSLPIFDINKSASRAASPMPELADYSDFYKLSQRLPVWNVDLEVFVVDLEIGRGMRTLRPFLKGDVIGMYDGHRCDEKGNIKIRLPSVTSVMSLFPQLDREKNTALSFQPSHSVAVSRNHLSGLFIDGGPLCDPILDALVNSLGRLALANSASSAQTANMKPVWVKSPNLPVDVIWNGKTGVGAANMECFFVATRDIPAKEELLWAYPIDRYAKLKVSALHPTPLPLVNGSSLPEKRNLSTPISLSTSLILIPHLCDHFTTCPPGKCTDCKCAKCIVNQVSGRRIRKSREFE